MENNKKRISIITIIIICIIIIAVALLCIKLFLIDKSDGNNDYKNESVISNIEGEEYIEYDSDVKINTSQFLQDTKYLDTFEFNNFYVYTIDGVTKIEYDVSNVSSDRKKLQSFKFIVYNENEKVGSLICNGDEFAANQTKRLSIVVNADIANLFDMEVEPIYNSSI